MKPTQILEMNGAFERNPKRAEGRRNEPKPAAQIGNAPTYFTPPQKKIWKEMVANSCPGVLGSSDRYTLELAVTLIEKLRNGKLSAIAHATLLTALAHLGMTPVHRHKVATPKAKEKETELSNLFRPTKNKFGGS